MVTLSLSAEAAFMGCALPISPALRVFVAQLLVNNLTFDKTPACVQVHGGTLVLHLPELQRADVELYRPMNTSPLSSRGSLLCNQHSFEALPS